MIHKKENVIMWEAFIGKTGQVLSEDKILPTWNYDKEVKALDWNQKPDMSLYQWDCWKTIVMFASQNKNTLQIAKQKLADYAAGVEKDGYVSHRYDQSLDVALQALRNGEQIRL